MIVFVFALSLTFPTQDSPKFEETVPAILEERVDRLERSVGLVVGIVDPNGERFFSRGSTRNEEGAPEVDEDTLFEIGSVTKVLTALLLSAMVHEGEVQLETHLHDLLPRETLPADSSLGEITLGHLATHYSGLPRHPPNMVRLPGNPYANYTRDKLEEFLKTFRPERPPGHRAVYSNLGFGLLGYALEQAGGASFEDLLDEWIHEPMGLTSTTLRLDASSRDRLAQPHDLALSPVEVWDLASLQAAGALKSSARDMTRFLAAHLRHVETSLSDAMDGVSLRAWTVSAKNNVRRMLAWGIRKRSDRVLVWHNGGTGGSRSFIGFCPETETGVVVLANAPTFVDDIGFHLLDPSHPLETLTPRPKAIELDVSQLKDRPGHYRLESGETLRLRLEGHQLLATLGEGAEHPIFPQSPTRFFYTVNDAWIEFDQEGSLRLTSFGETTKGVRIDR